jgi:L-ascorbate metabolism protein UlaG (beta-lactamase superfamily)
VQSKLDKADILLISHEHFDHLSIEDIMKTASDKTILIASKSSKEGLSKIKFKESRFLNPGEKVTLDNVIIEAIPAYNLNKFREPGKPFHPREEAKLGFLIQIGGVRVYHAGDTDFIPEMEGLKTDLALLPVSGTYVMTSQEAASAAAAIKPKLAIPMHFGTIVGSEKDAAEFKRLAPCVVQILKPE